MARGQTSTNPSEFEEELSAVAAEDQRAVDEAAELERMYQLEEARHQARADAEANSGNGGGAGQMLKGMARKEATALGKKALARGATTAAGEAVAAAGTASLAYYAAIALGVIIIIFTIIIIILAMMNYVCTQEGWKGWAARGMSAIASAIGASEVNVCGELAAVMGSVQTTPVTALDNTQLPNMPAAPVTDPSSGLVPITGVPVNRSSTSDARVTPCMLARIQNLYLLAQQNNIDFEITSAYRPNARTSTGGLSAHGRGEAVDFVIIPFEDYRQRPIYAAKVTQMVGLARNPGGFNPPAGDTLDEYRNKNEFTTGDHIHVEFNIPTTGSYCTLP